MPDPRLLTDRAELEALFAELAVELHRLGVTAEVVMVGGAWMLWHSQRASTRDVDSARQLDNDLADAIERVGSRHELMKGWLNDRAAPFWPATSAYEACARVFEHEALIVRTPSPEIMFVMKLYRADAQDREDLILLWPLCRFTDPAEAAVAFRDAYPHAPEDEYLADYIADIASDSAAG